jgi:hypothetical protein
MVGADGREKVRGEGLGGDAAEELSLDEGEVDALAAKV